jgi:hypothetical protein
MDVLVVRRPGARSSYFRFPGGNHPICPHLGEKPEARTMALPIHCSVTFGTAGAGSTKSMQQ